jgi:branched-chain amino acid transport system substrate-binding protein
MVSTITKSTPEKLKIGIGAPLSGRGEALGAEMVNAIQLTIDEANSSGGVAGLLVEGVVRDDKGDEAEGERVAVSFVGDPDVLAVIGHYNSNVTLRTAPLYSAAGLPVIAPIVSNPKLTDSGWRNVFRFTNRDDATARAIADYLVRVLQKSRAAVVTTKTVYGLSMSRQFAIAFVAAGGAILQESSVDEGKTEFRELVRHFPAEADVVFFGGTFEGAPLVREMRAQADDRLLATGDGCWDIGNFLEPAGGAAEKGEGVLVLSACPQLGEVSGSLQFAERYTRRFGAIRNYAVNSYDAAMTVIQAARHISTEEPLPRRDDVAVALGSIQRQGIAYFDAIRWDEKGDNRAAVTALHRIEDGHYRQIAMVGAASNRRAV